MLRKITDFFVHRSRIRSLARARTNRRNQAMDWLDHLDANQVKESALRSQELISSDTSIFSSRESIRTWSFRTLPKGHQTGLIMEFGVYGGKSLVQLAESAGRRVYGFDSFEGLRDPWSKPNRTSGAMDKGGQVPKLVRGREDVEIVLGWVEDTLDPFLREHNESISIVHLDMDVYAPTRFALERIKPRLSTGAHLIFDDLFGFIGWENHSYRALFEVFSEEELVAVALSPNCAVFRFLGRRGTNLAKRSVS